MNTNEFIAGTGVTDLDEVGYDLVVSRIKSSRLIVNRINNGLFDSIIEELDAIKKVIFYGKTPERSIGVDGGGPEISKDNAKLVHYLLGIITEAGELMPILRNALENKPIDKVNLVEELGDSLYYTARSINWLGTSFEEVMDTNQKKLRKRYGEKFTEHAAINRDLDSERDILNNHKELEK